MMKQSTRIVVKLKDLKISKRIRVSRTGEPGCTLKPPRPVSLPLFPGPTLKATRERKLVCRLYLK